MKLIFDGDSWTFGSEIVDPNLSAQYPRNTHPGDYDSKEVNDYYRIPKIYPYHMAKQLDCDYVNLGWPADDNRTIIERTMSYISTEYLGRNKPTDDIFVIIGWTSPERNSFWWKNGDFSRKFRLWPNCAHFDDRLMKKLWKTYVQHMWNPEEYIPRYVSTVLQFQNFCNTHNINWLCYNAFYQTPNEGPENWEDLNMPEKLKSIDCKVGRYIYSDNGVRTEKNLTFESLWNTIDPIRFYKKDQPNNTFKSFIEETVDDPLVGWHPSPTGHEAWATELVTYIKENNLL